MTQEEKQLIKARFFGQHIGCDVMVNDSLLLYDGVYKLSSVEWLDHGICLSFREETSNAWAIDDICKLILRPISSITNEEAIECARLSRQLRPNAKYRVCNSIAGNNLIVSEIGGSSFEDVILDFKNLPQSQSDYLRSKNFCLPFCGLDPVKEGWATTKEQ